MNFKHLYTLVYLELEAKLSANSQIDPKKGKLPPPPGNKPKPSLPPQSKPKPPAPIPPKPESDAAVPQKILGIFPRAGSMSSPKASLLTPEKESSKKDVQPTAKKEVSEILPEESKLRKGFCSIFVFSHLYSNQIRKF